MASPEPHPQEHVQPIDIHSLLHFLLCKGFNDHICDRLRDAAAQGRYILGKKLTVPVVNEAIELMEDFQSIKALPRSSLHMCGKRDGRMVRTTRRIHGALAGVGIDSVQDYDGELQCTICLNPAFGGVMTTPCAHYFHPSCLSKALATHARCPECRTEVTMNDVTPIKDVKEARFLWHSICALKVKCPADCGKHVTWESLEAHLRDDCSHVEVFCKYGGCKAHGSVQAICQHEVTCGEATMECRCGASFLRKDLEEHKEECPAELVSCKYCKRGGIQRNGMDVHYSECTGSVPMSEVWKLMTRLDELEAEVKRQRVQ